MKKQPTFVLLKPETSFCNATTKGAAAILIFHNTIRRIIAEGLFCCNEKMLADFRANPKSIPHELHIKNGKLLFFGKILEVEKPCSINLYPGNFCEKFKLLLLSFCKNEMEFSLFKGFSKKSTVKAPGVMSMEFEEEGWHFKPIALQDITDWPSCSIVCTTSQ